MREQLNEQYIRYSGADPAFLKGGGVADYSRPSNYTLIYFKLPYVCPKTL